MAECKEELTGRILQTETNGNDFVLDAASQPSRWKPKQGWRSVLEVAAVVGLVALLATVIALAVVLSRNNINRGIDPACIHALGGGPIKNGGSMEIKAPDYCKAQLRAYADNSRGSYWRVSHATMTKTYAGSCTASTGAMQPLCVAAVSVPLLQRLVGGLVANAMFGYPFIRYHSELNETQLCSFSSRWR
jgi:hypothetical protein